MGIRIRKVLGYGLTGVESQECQITDVRFTKKLKDPEDESLYDLTVQSYITWLKQKAALNKLNVHESATLMNLEDLPEKAKNESLGRCVVYDFEFGLDGFVIFVPPEHFYSPYDPWYRYDSAIDYYEQSIDMKPELQEIPVGIHPYDMTIDRNTRKQLIEKRQDLAYGLPDPYPEIKQPVPNTIKLFTAYLKIFRRKAVAEELRPYVYTYWA